MDAHSELRGRWRLAALAAIVLSACGGGGDSSAPTPSASAPPRPLTQSDLQIAQSVYGTGPRTPAGFYADPPPSGHDYVSTMHLKNSDVDAAAIAPQPLYELCTNDWNKALAWSELGAHNSPQYSDLVETNDDPRYFEFGRVRQGDPTFYVRARVFKCAYLDRTDANLRVAAGSAGELNRRPLTAADLRELSEYLWQFTQYNNVGYAVLGSSGSGSAAALTHTLHLGVLARGALSSACDRVDVIAWRHTLDTTTGNLQLEATTLWSFGAHESAGAVSLCSG
ncbi:MAG: hypothetical protein ACREXP_09385 [Steroidobacteraceae bacterium]